jgi:cell division control protein 6
VAPAKTAPGTAAILAEDATTRAKRMLSAATQPTVLLGREAEAAAIFAFAHGHLVHRTAGSMYLSGQPGTGKTATVTHVHARLVAAKHAFK